MYITIKVTNLYKRKGIQGDDQQNVTKLKKMSFVEKEIMLRPMFKLKVDVLGDWAAKRKDEGSTYQ